MSLSLFNIFAALAAELAGDPETGQLVKDVATGEGGAQKVLKVGTDLAVIAGHAMFGLAAAPATEVSPSSVQPLPAPPPSEPTA